MSVNEKIIFILAKDNEDLSNMTPGSFYPIGMAGVVTEINSQGYAVIRTQYRVNIENVEVAPDRTISLTLSRRAEVQDLDEAVAAEKLKNLLQEMRHFSQGFQWADAAEYYISHIDSIGGAACILSPWLKLSNAERYDILAEDSQAARAERIETVLYEFTRERIGWRSRRKFFFGFFRLRLAPRQSGRHDEDKHHCDNV